MGGTFLWWGWGGDAYNKMPCYFEYLIVNSQPWSPKPHCMCGLGVGRGVEADKYPVNSLERCGELYTGRCSDLYWKKQINIVLKSCFYILFHGHNNVELLNNVLH